MKLFARRLAAKVPPGLAPSENWKSPRLTRPDLLDGAAGTSHTHSTRQILQRNRGAFLAKNGTDTWRYQQKVFYNGGQYDHE